MLEDFEKITKMIDCNFLLKNTKMDATQVKKYYKLNKFAYRKIYSNDGFMHMRISIDGKIKDEDLLYQVNKVDEHLGKAKHVLELGCGQGANISVLASRHPNIDFKGIDLYPSIKKELSNVELISGDYHNMPFFDDNTFDVVYAFETLCHSTDKEKLFKEIFRVLKKGGIFILYDGYANKKDKSLTKQEKEIMTLVEKGMCVDKFDFINDVEKHIKKAGFKTISSTDMSDYVLPNMKYLKNKVAKFFKLGYSFRLICKILPKKFVGNAVSGYLLYGATKEGLFVYKESIYKE